MRILFVSFIVSLFFVSCGGSAPKTAVKPANLDSLVKVYPDSIPLLLEYGKQLLDDYRAVEALPLTAKAFRLDTTNIEARYLYSLSLINRAERSQADVDVAQKYLRYITLKQPKNKEAFVNLASTYTLQGDFENSFKNINIALKIDKRFRDAYVMKGTNYIALGDRKLAKSSFETAVQQDPEFFAGYMQLGWLYSEDGEYKFALEYFRTAAQIEPKSVDALYGIAYSLQELQNYPDALAGYRHLIETDTSYYLAFFNQGYIKQFNQNELDSAVFFYKKSIEMQPDFVKGWHNLGLCYVQQGRKSLAFKSFKKALEYNPDFELSKKEIVKLK
jgi:tetratricopeptide (TPR) repeat protein